MSTSEYRAATSGKLARIEENPRFAVLMELRTGIEAATEAIKSTSRGNQQDAKRAYSRVLDLMTRTQSVMRDPIVQKQFTLLETLLRRIASYPK